MRDSVATKKDQEAMSANRSMGDRVCGDEKDE